REGAAGGPAREPGKESAQEPPGQNEDRRRRDRRDGGGEAFGYVTDAGKQLPLNHDRLRCDTRLGRAVHVAGWGASWQRSGLGRCMATWSPRRISIGHWGRRLGAMPCRSGAIVLKLFVALVAIIVVTIAGVAVYGAFRWPDVT